MPSPTQGPDLAYRDVVRSPGLTPLAVGVFGQIHRRAHDGQETSLVDLLAVANPGETDTGLLAALDELTTAGILDAAGWPRTVVKP